MLEHKTPEEDFYAWATNTAARARAGTLTPQELEEVAEEIEGMAKSERRELRNRLDESPSLKPEINDFIEKAYKISIQKAVQDTNLNKNTFPSSFKETGWSYSQILDEEFFP